VLPEVEFPFRPFARWKYSNLGYCVLGEVVERASGQPFTEFVTARLIEPLGMDEVTFDPASLPRIRLARGYRRAPDRDCVARDPQAWEPAAAASGQLFGTVLDLCTLGAFLSGAQDGAVPRSETREEMRRPAAMADDAWERAHGLGPVVVRRGSAALVGHTAELPTFSGWLLVSADSGVGAVLMANAGQAPFLPLVASMIEEAAACLPAPVAVPSPWPPPAIEEILGRYTGDGGTLALEWRGGRLVARGPSAVDPEAPEASLDVELDPEGTDAFRFLEGPYCGEPMRVLRHPSGRIHGFEVCNRSYERI